MTYRLILILHALCLNCFAAFAQIPEIPEYRAEVEKWRTLQEAEQIKLWNEYRDLEQRVLLKLESAAGLTSENGAKLRELALTGMPAANSAVGELMFESMGLAAPLIVSEIVKNYPEYKRPQFDTVKVTFIPSDPEDRAKANLVEEQTRQAEAKINAWYRQNFDEIEKRFLVAAYGGSKSAITGLYTIYNDHRYRGPRAGHADFWLQRALDENLAFAIENKILGELASWETATDREGFAEFLRQAERSGYQIDKHLSTLIRSRESLSSRELSDVKFKLFTRAARRHFHDAVYLGDLGLRERIYQTDGIVWTLVAEAMAENQRYRLGMNASLINRLGDNLTKVRQLQRNMDDEHRRFTDRLVDKYLKAVGLGKKN